MILYEKCVPACECAKNHYWSAKKILLSVKKEIYSYLVVPRWSRDGRGDDRTLRFACYRTAVPTERSLCSLQDARFACYRTGGALQDAALQDVRFTHYRTGRALQDAALRLLQDDLSISTKCFKPKMSISTKSFMEMGTFGMLCCGRVLLEICDGCANFFYTISGIFEVLRFGLSFLQRVQRAFCSSPCERPVA